MGKPKCKTCNGCMDFIWVDNNRYLNCWFCKTWFTGQLGNLVEVENPYLIDCPNCSGVGAKQYEDGMWCTCPACNGTKRIDRRTLNV